MYPSLVTEIQVVTNSPKTIFFASQSCNIVGKLKCSAQTLGVDMGYFARANFYHCPLPLKILELLIILDCFGISLSGISRKTLRKRLKNTSNIVKSEQIRMKKLSVWSVGIMFYLFNPVQLFNLKFNKHYVYPELYMFCHLSHKLSFHNEPHYFRNSIQHV